jgi:hypothetical protein
VASVEMLIRIDLREVKVAYFTLLSYRHVGALEIPRLYHVFFILKKHGFPTS